MNIRRIYDISITLGRQTPENIRGKAYRREQIDLPNGEEIFKGSSIELSVHIGTHVDAPCHMAHLSKSVDEYDLRRFILPATVVEVEDLEAIRRADIERAAPMPDTALLFKTENSRSGKASDKRNFPFYVYMDIDGLEEVLRRRVSLLGFDYKVAEKPGMPVAPIHRGCFDHDVIILEGIDLKDVPAGNYTLIAFPLKMEGSDGAPVRAVLIEE
jgi:arylformamidase